MAFANFKIALELAYDKSKIVTFDGVEQFFELLRENNIKIVLNTGYDSKTANKLMDKLGWKVGKQVDALITSDDVKNGRPSPDMIQLAMVKFGITDGAQVLKGW